MNRRDAVLALVALGTVSLAARAQPTAKVYRIGVLSHYVPPERFVVLSSPMRDLGYEEGRNIAFDYRFAEGRDDRLPGLAAELVAKKVDLIIA